MATLDKLKKLQDIQAQQTAAQLAQDSGMWQQFERLHGMQRADQMFPHELQEAAARASIAGNMADYAPRFSQAELERMGVDLDAARIPREIHDIKAPFMEPQLQEELRQSRGVNTASEMQTMQDFLARSIGPEGTVNPDAIGMSLGLLDPSNPMREAYAQNIARDLEMQREALRQQVEAQGWTEENRMLAAQIGEPVPENAAPPVPLPPSPWVQSLSNTTQNVGRALDYEKDFFTNLPNDIYGSVRPLAPMWLQQYLPYPDDFPMRKQQQP